MLDWYYKSLKSMPTRVKWYTHAVNIIDSDYMIILNTAITSLENTLKKIYLSATLMNELTSTYENDNNYSFEMFFNNIKLVLLTTFISQPYLKNEKLRWIKQFMKITWYAEKIFNIFRIDTELFNWRSEYHSSCLK